MSPGQHTVRVVAVDSQGLDSSFSWSFTVDSSWTFIPNVIELNARIDELESRLEEVENKLHGVNHNFRTSGVT